jgi:hypothetical protein
MHCLRSISYLYIIKNAIAAYTFNIVSLCETCEVMKFHPALLSNMMNCFVQIEAICARDMGLTQLGR